MKKNGAVTIIGELSDSVCKNINLEKCRAGEDAIRAGHKVSKRVYTFKDLQLGTTSSHTDLDTMLGMLIEDDPECELDISELTEAEKINEIEGYEYEVIDRTDGPGALLLDKFMHYIERTGMCLKKLEITEYDGKALVANDKGENIELEFDKDSLKWNSISN